MKGPAPTLCPKCDVRPRRKSGQWCTLCTADYQRAYRAGKRVPKIRNEVEIRQRFTRPLEASRYIVTSAQNATPVHEEFFATLQVAAKRLGAELVVIPLRYKNPTSVWTKDSERDDWWASEVRPYLFNTRKKLCANLVLVGDVKIQPTAVNPLAGFEALTGAESCILGHPKMQFRSVPAPTGRMPKILTTTGAVTRRNYSDTRAGKLGSFHHYLGAVIVEVEGKEFHLRQINADRIDGSFTDLDLHFTARGVKKAPPAEGLILGDTHARFTSASVDAATFGPGGMVEVLDPKRVVFHDLLDGYSVNHHHQGNPFIAQAKMRARLGNAREEVQHAVDFVKTRTAGRQAVVVASNHDDFLARWLAASDWRHSPGNAEFYLETALHVVRSAKITESGAEYDDAFTYWVKRLKGDAQIKCLGKNESFKICGIECGMHGHKGPNGAKPTPRNLARLGSKTFTGHSHTPGIEEGGYKVGTSTPLHLEYTEGPSSWLNTHGVIYATGARALLTMVGSRWRGKR